MKFDKTSTALTRLIDEMKRVEKRKGEYLQSIGGILSPQYLKTYSAEYQESERLRLNRDYMEKMMEDSREVKKRCAELLAAYEKDTAAKSDTSSTVQLCMNYLTASGCNYDPRYLDIIGKPLREAGDIYSMREIRRLCEVINPDSPKIPFEDTIGDYYDADEVGRKLAVLTDAVKKQLPREDIDFDSVSAAYPVLDKWGVQNLVDYANGIIDGISGREGNRRVVATFGNMGFASVR